MLYYGDEARLKVEHRWYVIMTHIGHSRSDCEVLVVMVCSRTAGGLLHGNMRGYQQLQDACMHMAECAEGFALQWKLHYLGLHSCNSMHNVQAY